MATEQVIRQQPLIARCTRMMKSPSRLIAAGLGLALLAAVLWAVGGFSAIRSIGRETISVDSRAGRSGSLARRSDRGVIQIDESWPRPRSDRWMPGGLWLHASGGPPILDPPQWESGLPRVHQIPSGTGRWSGGGDKDVSLDPFHQQPRPI